MNVLLSPSSVEPAVEKLGVGITLFKVGETCTLLFSGSLKDREANDPPF
jgi:hypothetical protein